MTALARIAALLDAPPDPCDHEAAQRWITEFDETLGCHDPAWLEKLAKFMEANNGNETELR